MELSRGTLYISIYGSPQVRVNRGVELMNKRFDNWWKRINTDWLDQSHWQLCVLGQALRAGERVVDVNAIEYGFDSYDEDDAVELTKHWRKVVEEYQEADAYN